jgi:hypothetical protein
MKTKQNMNPSHCPWHAADLDGRYVVRNYKEEIVFEHALEFPRDKKVQHVFLAAAAPDMLLALREMVLLAGERSLEKPFDTNRADWKNAVDKAKAAIARTNPEI